MYLKASDPGAHLYQVYKDGKFLDMCIEADEEEGSAIVMRHTDLELKKPTRSYFKVFGKIEVRPYTPQSL